jgi:hypothetical protein
LLDYALLFVAHVIYVVDYSDATTSAEISRFADPYVLIGISSLLTASEMFNELFIIIRQSVSSWNKVIDLSKHSLKTTN